MFANRFTVLVDACSLAGVLNRNLICTLARAEFFRLRWSESILDETERAIAAIQGKRGKVDPQAEASRNRRALETAFEDAMVSDFDHLLPACRVLPDPNDAHVLAAAIRTGASVIVTENLSDFPTEIIQPLGLEARSADAFVADTISLDPGRAVEAIRRMRARLIRPEKSTDQLLFDMEAVGLVETVGMLRSHAGSL